MKSIVAEYKHYIEQNLSGEKEFFTTVDEDIIPVLAAAGFNTDQIKAGLLKCSPVLRNQHNTFIETYFTQKIPSMSISVAVPKVMVEFAYNQEKKRFADKIMHFYLPVDRNAANSLLDTGWEITKIQDVLLTKSALARELPDSKIVYCDQVLAGINQKRMNHLSNLMSVAEALYLQKAAAITNKYRGYQQKFNEFQEGSIVLSMMLQSRISTDIIDQVLRKHSRNEAMQHDPNYVSRILLQCELVNNTYLAIARADDTYPQTPRGYYERLARDYMHETKSVMLNGKDDLQIIRRMHSDGYEPHEIQNAVLQASPVAREPGRNPHQYAAASIAVIDNEYTMTAALYDEKRHQILDQQRQSQNQTYLDGTIVRDLLEMQYRVPYIRKAVMEKSNEPRRKKAGYAQKLIISAQKAIQAEKSILEYQKPIPEGHSYSKLLRLGYAAVDLYRNAIKERVRVYPSVALSLTADFIDKDACEKLLTQYPGIDLDDMKQAIRLNSPRAQMPGISRDYPEEVIEAVFARIEKVHEQETRAKNVQQEYMKQCGLANEGIEPEAHMVAYHDGRAALNLLEKGIARNQIREALEWGAQERQNNPGEYAEQILQQVEAVHQRIQDIQAHTPATEPKNAVEEYRSRLQKAFTQRRYISSSVDVTIATGILLMGYQMPDIIDAIQQYSPAAAEPGRGDRYGDFIADKAKENIEQEQRKEQLYIPIPRLKREESAQKEYEHHVRELQTQVQLPLTQEMDLKIAKTMLKQGYNQKELITALDQSVYGQQQKQKHYGKDLVKQAMEAGMVQTLTLERERSRTKSDS